MPIVTADIHDAHPDEVSVIDAQFRGFGRRPAFAGPASTVRTSQDHRPVFDAVSRPGNGHVLVIDGGGSLRVGLLGGRIAATAVRTGWRGVIVYGAIRDSAEIDALPIGVKALGTTARRAQVEIGGELDVALSVGGVDVKPGDWIYADPDAVLVAPHRFADVAPDF